MNLWRGSNPDYNANKTAAGVALALKQFKQIAQQPQNMASSRARYMAFVVPFMLSEILHIISATAHHFFNNIFLSSLFIIWLFKTSLILIFHWCLTIILKQNKFKPQAFSFSNNVTADLHKRKKTKLIYWHHVSPIFFSSEGWLSNTGYRKGLTEIECKVPLLKNNFC